ncbi:MAG: ABC transporter ATP-binding protein [Verrucomicrobiota bacterium]
MNSSSGQNPRACVDPAVDIRSLRVDYGDFVAVDDLTLAVPRSEILGIVGPNGAGKTSTFRVLATLMEPTHGDVYFEGVDIAEDTRQARRLMGYMPDLAPVPSDLKVWEFLDFYAAAYGLRDARVRRRRADRCLETVGLSNLRNNGCRELSRGQTQRVVLAKTLLHEPRGLILDEPPSGLDPLARRDLRTALWDAEGGAGRRHGRALRRRAAPDGRSDHRDHRQRLPARGDLGREHLAVLAARVGTRRAAVARRLRYAGRPTHPGCGTVRLVGLGPVRRLAHTPDEDAPGAPEEAHPRGLSPNRAKSPGVRAFPARCPTRGLADPPRDEGTHFPPMRYRCSAPRR